MQKTNLAWALVIFGGIVECFWVSGLKYANSFALYIFTGLGILISFCCMLYAMKRIEVSVAYAVFVGIGTAGVVLSEIFFFHEPFSLLKVILIAVLLFGVIGLKFTSKEYDDDFVKEVSKDLGLDELEQTRTDR
ncbi:QacE family quaternary ammonium compound efflux SMR transporter [Campylobacter sp. MIT 99-7217]|uniref:DMT family transporter n=1 Tax=Campylobacter sp. MIT 99-7217 TaxID=535091 RepID=UPI0011599E65|nr:multidrug efflux SMR transporter [Campylobacter sp. MIT 99-7217]TQR29056.1 QacE family quaternary ammonium compound efflux SMR transporter [Campylobacter sp. MIT 99-7217]